MVRSGSSPERVILAELLNHFELFGAGAEVGTFEGEHVEMTLNVWRRGKIYAIDPWAPGQVIRGEKMGERLFEMAQGRLAEWIRSGRCKLVRGTSMGVVDQFADAQLDYVYLDGDHRYPAVKDDLEHWWPKVRHGGIVAGHDYKLKGKIDQHVAQAVMEFFYPSNNKFCLVATGNCHTFICRKGHPEGLAETVRTIRPAAIVSSCDSEYKQG